MAQMYKRVTRVRLEELRLKASDPKTVYAGLLQIRDLKAYKEGWAYIKFKEIFGRTPDFGGVLPGDPSADLMAWLRRSNRAYGLRMARLAESVLPKRPK